MKQKNIFCPVCGRKYCKALYDFEYIHCNFDGCGYVFDKETGKILAETMERYRPIPYKEADEHSHNNDSRAIALLKRWGSLGKKQLIDDTDTFLEEIAQQADLS